MRLWVNRFTRRFVDDRGHPRPRRRRRGIAKRAVLECHLGHRSELQQRSGEVRGAARINVAQHDFLAFGEQQADRG